MRSKKLAIAGLMSAFISVMSVWQIPLPFPVPLTLQTFAVSFSGYTLGIIGGTVPVLCYIAIGCIGVPVFTGFRGGISPLFEFGGGFIIGFVFLALLCGMGKGKNTSTALLLGLTGILVCHSLGVMHYMNTGGPGFVSAFSAISAPFLLKDILMTAFAFFAAQKIKKTIK